MKKLFFAVLLLAQLCAAQTAIDAGRVRFDPNTVTFSATPTFNALKTSFFKMTLTGNVTSSTLSNAVSGVLLYFEICQDGTGGRTFVPPTNVSGWVTISSTASACTLETFIFDGTNAQPNAINWAAPGAIGITTPNTGVFTTLQSSSAITTTQSSPTESLRAGNKNSLEWGHSNAAGYGNNIGYESTSGQPFICFYCEAGTNANTYRTRGNLAFIIKNTGAVFQLGTVSNNNADNQTFSNLFQFNTSGAITVPNATDTLVGRATTDTLTNKTLTSPVISNTVTSYNGLSTVSEGLPHLVAKADATAQQANVGSTLLFTTVTAGQYMIMCSVTETQAATTSSTLPSCQVSWTDPDTNLAANNVAITVTSTTNAAGVVGVAGSVLGGAAVINAKAGTAINWSTASYASSGATVMQYAVHVKLSYLGN